MNDNKHLSKNAFNKISQLVFRLLFYTKKSEPFSYAKDYSYNLVFEDLCNELTTTNETILFLEKLETLLSNNVELEEYFADRLDKIGGFIYDEIIEEDILAEIDTHGSGALTAQSRWLTKRFEQINKLRETIVQHKKIISKLETSISNAEKNELTIIKKITQYDENNLSNVDLEINIKKNVQGQSNNESVAEKYLYFLKGKNLAGKNYMTLEQYNYLIKATNYLIDKLEIPENLNPIRSNYIKAGEIRYSFYLMTKDKYPNGDYSENIFIFLSKIFPKLNDSKVNYRDSANYKKFKSMPQYYEELLKRNK